MDITTHNLRIPELELPERALVVITGPSGSGKSSLAFDTLAVEGKRRYLLALSLTEEVRVPSPPPVREAEGIPPAVALPQRIPPPNPRITLGTVTGVLEKLRRILAQIGEIPCPGCGKPIRIHTLSEVLARFEALPEGTRLLLTAPLHETSEKALSYLLGEGFNRFFINDRVYDLTEENPPSEILRAEVVVDRLIIKRTARMRLIEALRLAERLSGGPVVLRLLEGPPHFLTLGPRCPHCLSPIPEMRPEDFSFNHPRGACPACGGIGEREGKTCPACKGLRLKREALEVRLLGDPLRDLLSLPLSAWPSYLAEKEKEAGPHRSHLRALKQALRPLLETLNRLGLGHLNLLSPFHRLSTGERKRVELSGLLSHQLSGVLFIFDEPGLGLSPQEKKTLLLFLRRLVLSGNTVLVVEHDPVFIREADLVVELGPGAGPEGGRLLFVGPPEELARRTDLPTGAFLSGKKRLRRNFRPERRPLELPGFPALWEGGLTVLCGASGSGKTLLLREMAARLEAAGHKTAFLSGELPGKTRGMVASFLGVFDELRRLFAATPEARALGLSPAHFSPFSREGRCPYCHGEGKQKTGISGLLETETPCEECQGSGLKPEALKVTYRGLRFPEVLALSLSEALGLFSRIPAVAEKLSAALEKGLGYLRLGQDLRTLSGGEKLRLRLTRETLRRSGAEVLLLDLPSMGLHLADLERLLAVFEDLLRRGKTLVLAENQPLLALLSDEIWVVEKEGIVFSGSPREFLSQGPPISRQFEPYLSLVEGV